MYQPAHKDCIGGIGAIDGWFPRTETMPRGVSNQADYFSGHYVAYGLNIQAMCDPDLIFMYVAVAGPEKLMIYVHSLVVRG